MELNNKIAVVTGASSGLGMAMSEKLINKDLSTGTIEIDVQEYTILNKEIVKCLPRYDRLVARGWPHTIADKTLNELFNTNASLVGHNLHFIYDGFSVGKLDVIDRHL